MKRIFLLVLLLAGLYIGTRYYVATNFPHSEIESRVEIKIPIGSSAKAIAFLLAQNDIINDPWVFYFWSRWQGLASKYQSGEYIIKRNLTYKEVAEIIQHGRTKDIKITIPEGYTIQQIDTLLAKKSLIEDDAFYECTKTCDLGFRIAHLEGFLFPSTYIENIKNFSTLAFIKRLYNTFLQQIKPFREKIKADGKTIEDVVIVASMIEKEATGDTMEERKLISGVIWKRLKISMHLGIDATTRYEKNDWKNPLYADDFEKDSLYNTRKNYGLPPTAISNPGLLSLEAATYPVESDYLYYLHDRNGQIYFGKTLQEHNLNKKKYLQ